MTLTLTDSLITNPYGVLEDVLMKVDDLLFMANFVVLDMDKYSKVPLLYRIHFLETSRDLIDIEFGELILRYEYERVIFNVF